MKGLVLIAIGCCLLVLPAFLPCAHAQQDKIAQTGMKFLSFSPSPRAAALGDAMTAMEGDAQNLFYNPAGMAWQRSFVSASMATTQWIAGIEYYAGSLSLRPGGGRLGVFGLSFMSVDFGDLEETIRFDNDQGFLDIGTFNPTSWVVGLGYARPLSDRFSAGGHVKYAVENLAESITGYDAAGENEYVRSDNSAKVYAFDFGVLYRTGFHSLNFAVNARNFSEEIAYEEESFQLPLTLSIGVSMDVMDLLTEPGTGNPYGERNRKTHALRISLDASNPRDFSEQIKVGGEYSFLQTFSLRAGYIFPTDVQGLTLGVGVQRLFRNGGFGADYSATTFDIFSTVHRISLSLSI